MLARPSLARGSIPNGSAAAPDGSIRFAENPPKKYEDIVNVDFYAEGAMPELWLALRDVVLLWADEGVRIFRVDNPHTKPLPFWEWMIADVRGRHPDVIFLAEAFTRPAMMYRLAKVGFSQSYTYFTWRNSKGEIDRLSARAHHDGGGRAITGRISSSTRPTSIPVFLQSSGRAGFLIRAALAATLVRPVGRLFRLRGLRSRRAAGPRGVSRLGEVRDARPRDFNAPGNIVAEITALNRLRRAHPALHSASRRALLQRLQRPGRWSTASRRPTARR